MNSGLLRLRPQTGPGFWIVVAALTIAGLGCFVPSALANQRPANPCRVLVVNFIGGIGPSTFPPTMTTPLMHSVRELGYPGLCTKNVSVFSAWRAGRWVRKQILAEQKTQTAGNYVDLGFPKQSFTDERLGSTRKKEKTRGPEIETDEMSEASGVDPTINHPKIIVLGYSLGVCNAVRFTETLERMGVPVELLITVDSKCPTDGIIPENVKKAVNFYERWLYPMFFPLYYGRNDFRAADPSRTDFLGNIQVLHAGHFTIVKLCSARDLIVETIRKAYQSDSTYLEH